MSGNYLSYPTNEVASWDGSGVQAYWTSEEGQIAASKNKFGESTQNLKKLAALVKVTDELLDDSLALENIVNNDAGDAIMHKVNSAIIRGSGSGQPQGILNSAFLLSIAYDDISISEGIKLCRKALDKSLVRDKLEELITLTQSYEDA